LEKNMADEKMVKVETFNLSGAALDWVVAKCEGHKPLYANAPHANLKNKLGNIWHIDELNYSANQELAGQIIDRELIDVFHVERAGPVWEAEIQIGPKQRVKGRGNTRLGAAMRCYAVSQLGPTVEIPVELLESSNMAHLLQSAEDLKASERAIAAEIFQIAHGDPAKIKQLEAKAHAEDVEKMHARILYSVINNTGMAAPKPGTPQYEALSQKLARAVDSASLERETLFSPVLRAALEEAYFQSENDSGEYDKVAIHGKPSLAGESDKELLERILLNVSGNYLRVRREPPNQHESVWLPDEDQEFIKVMGTNPTAITVAMNFFDDIEDLLGEISNELTELGLTNPYAHLHENTNDTPNP
jgi:Protein of unknown function (DUF2591)